jgi:hypothetical protein
MIKRGQVIRRSKEASPAGQPGMSDKLIETINNLTANKELVNTKLSVLNGEGLKTASILEIGGIFRSLVTQVAVMYETEDFEKKIAPHIEKRFEELGKPSLIPGTIGSYIFGCYLSDYGLPGLNKFCTPICAASIRIPNKKELSMRCMEKVIWTDGGDTPIFILVEDDPSNSSRGKVFIPWVGEAGGFRGLTQGAVDEISSLGVDHVEIYGQLYNNRYIELLGFTAIKDIQIVERIRIRTVEYVSSKNGGVTEDKIHKVTMNQSPLRKDEESIDRSSTDPTNEPVKKKMDTVQIVGIVIVVFIILFVVGVVVLSRRVGRSLAA